MKLASLSNTTPIYQVLEAVNQKPAPGDSVPLTWVSWPEVQKAHRILLEQKSQSLRPPEVEKSGSGMVIYGGGIYSASTYVTLKMNALMGWKGKTEIWYLGKEEMDSFHQKLFNDLGAECIDATTYPEWEKKRIRNVGWHLKPFSLRHTSIRHVIGEDADMYWCINPESLFSTPQYLTTGALFWPDDSPMDLGENTWEILGVNPPTKRWSFESGEMVVDTHRHWLPLTLAGHINDHCDYYYCDKPEIPKEKQKIGFFWGDKESYALAWYYLGSPFSMPSTRWVKVGSVLIQYDFDAYEAKPIGVHRCRAKFSGLDAKGGRALFWTTPQDVAGPQFNPHLPLEREAHLAHREYLKCLRQSSPLLTAS